MIVTSEMTRVVVGIVNDYPIVTGGLRHLLEPYADQVVVKEFVGTLPRRGEVDVVLFDPFGHVDAQRQLARLVEGSDARVLYFAWDAADDEGRVARNVGGAAGYLSKTADGPAILAAITGDANLSPTDDASSSVFVWPGKEQGLTEREGQVIALVTQGLSNVGVGEVCYLSVNSVKTYIRSAYRKMGVNSRTKAVLWGIDHGMRPAPRAPERSG